jgi:hypothetical protein
MADEPEPFATHEDLEKRWHTLTPDEQAQADELLLDASENIRNHVSVYPETHEDSWWTAHRRGLEIVCCQMVRTAMEQQVSGVPTGVTQNTETTGPFSNSYSWLRRTATCDGTTTTSQCSAWVASWPSASTWHPGRWSDGTHRRLARRART